MSDLNENDFKDLNMSVHFLKLDIAKYNKTDIKIKLPLEFIPVV
jgi:hypothetical protein